MGQQDPAKRLSTTREDGSRDRVKSSLAKNTVSSLVQQNVSNLERNLIPSSRRMDGENAQIAAAQPAGPDSPSKHVSQMVDTGIGIEKCDKSIQTDKSYLANQTMRDSVPGSLGYALPQPTLLYGQTFVHAPTYSQTTYQPVATNPPSPFQKLNLSVRTIENLRSQPASNATHALPAGVSFVNYYQTPQTNITIQPNITNSTHFHRFEERYQQTSNAGPNPNSYNSNGSGTSSSKISNVVGTPIQPATVVYRSQMPSHSNIQTSHVQNSQFVNYQPVTVVNSPHVAVNQNTHLYRSFYLNQVQNHLPASISDQHSRNVSYTLPQASTA